MEERIEVQKGENGEIVFKDLNRADLKSYDNHFKDFFDEILGPIDSLINVLKEDDDDLLHYGVVLESIYRDIGNRVEVVSDFIRKTLGEIKFQFRAGKNVSMYTEKPLALIFTPGGLLEKQIPPTLKAKGQKVKAGAGAGGF